MYFKNIDKSKHFWWQDDTDVKRQMEILHHQDMKKEEIQVIYILLKAKMKLM